MPSFKKNSPQVWNNVWADPGISKADQLILATERATIRWARLRVVLRREFGSLKNLEVLEIGSGIGTYAALLASEGAQATLLDYSSQALARAKEFFAHNKLKAQLVQADALKLSLQKLTQKFKKKFDLAISVGLTEHFKGKERLVINQRHFEVLKTGGLAVIIVPNQYNLPYRVFKFCAELLGRWKYGEEYPYSRQELRKICAACGGELVALFGDDCYQSLKFLLPANFLRRFFGVGTPRTLAEIKPEKGTFLDNYLSYSLVLVAKKCA